MTVPQPDPLPTSLEPSEWECKADLAAEIGDAGQACIGGDQCAVEGFGDGKLGDVVTRDLASQLPTCGTAEVLHRPGRSWCSPSPTERPRHASG